MKTITVTDEDYETLMKLSEELQTQDNIGQAFPYYWEPSSYKRKPSYNDEGEFIIVYDTHGCDSYSPKDLFEDNDDLLEEFKDQYKDEFNDALIIEEKETKIDYEQIGEYWIEFLRDHDRYEIYYENKDQEQERNFSLFHSDVKNFIKYNKHHLGEKPHTYARTIWRMPKMESLVKCILNLNKNHDKEINEEAKRFIK